MKRYLITVLCMLMTDALWAHSEWQCLAQDNTKHQWIGKHGYERVATNKAIAACKKESTVPTSCKVLSEACLYFIGDKAFRSDPSHPHLLWQCTALDHQAKTWVGQQSEHRDDAALDAKTYCEEHSRVPDTCYMNFSMCQRTSE